MSLSGNPVDSDLRLETVFIKSDGKRSSGTKTSNDNAEPPTLKKELNTVYLRVLVIYMYLFKIENVQLYVRTMT